MRAITQTGAACRTDKAMNIDFPLFDLHLLLSRNYGYYVGDVIK
jgi:hypothetical protein